MEDISNDKIYEIYDKWAKALNGDVEVKLNENENKYLIPSAEANKRFMQVMNNATKGMAVERSAGNIFTKWGMFMFKLKCMFNIKRWWRLIKFKRNAKKLWASQPNIYDKDGQLNGEIKQMINESNSKADARNKLAIDKVKASEMKSEKLRRLYKGEFTK